MYCEYRCVIPVWGDQTILHIKKPIKNKFSSRLQAFSDLRRVLINSVCVFFKFLFTSDYSQPVCKDYGLVYTYSRLPRMVVIKGRRQTAKSKMSILS